MNCSPSRIRFSASFASPACASAKAEAAAAVGSWMTRFPFRTTSTQRSVNTRALGETDHVQIVRRVRNPQNFGFSLCRLREAAKLGETHDQPDPVTKQRSR